MTAPDTISLKASLAKCGVGKEKGAGTNGGSRGGQRESLPLGGKVARLRAG